MIEEWRPTHHPDYDVSNLGRVRSRARGKNNYILKPGIASHGYPTVNFGRNNSVCVHRLVAAAFLGPCPPKMECRHKDDNRANPRANNLEWGTRADNVRDMLTRNRYVCYMRTAKRDWHGRILPK